MAWNDEPPEKKSWTDAPPPKDEKNWYDVSPSGVWQATKDAFIPSLPSMDSIKQSFTRLPRLENIGHSALNAIPVVGAIGGGAVAGPGGAAAGGVAGESLKSSIESALGLGDKTRGEFYGDLAKTGLASATGQMQAEALPAMAAAAGKVVPKVGKALTGTSEAATENYMKDPQGVKDLANQSDNSLQLASDQMTQRNANAINSTKSELEKPTLQIMADRGTAASDRQIGDSIKQVIQSDVTQKYGPFQDAYQRLDTVNNALPMGDEALRTLREKTMNWARNSFSHSGESYNMVNKYMDSAMGAGNGQQFKGVIGDIQDAKDAAWRAGERTKYGVLTDLSERVNDFFENQISGLAKKVSIGTASEQEIGAFGKMAEAQGIQETDPTKYAKSIASDYLKNAERVNSDYSGFKDYLGDINEQTKVKGGTTIKLLQNLNSMPSEKLVANVDTLFDKNTASLEKMKAETPQAFDQIARYRIKAIIQDSTVDGSLDATKFHDNVMDLQPEARRLLFSPEELKTIQSTAQNPKLVKLNSLVDEMHPDLITPRAKPDALLAAGSGKTTTHVRNLTELSQLTGVNMVRDAQKLNAMRELGSPAWISRGGAGAALGAAGGAALGYKFAGPAGAEALGATGSILGGAATSPRVLKGAIDLGQLAKPVVNAAPTLQNVVRGGMGMKSLKTFGGQ